MIPTPMPPEDFALFLERVAHEIRNHASDEGSITWGVPGLGPWDKPAPPHSAHPLYVMAMVRSGNGAGQGGAWVIGEAEQTADPPVYDDERDPDGLRSQF